MITYKTECRNNIGATIKIFVLLTTILFSITLVSTTWANNDIKMRFKIVKDNLLLALQEREVLVAEGVKYCFNNSSCVPGSPVWNRYNTLDAQFMKWRETFEFYLGRYFWDHRDDYRPFPKPLSFNPNDKLEFRGMNFSVKEWYERSVLFNDDPRNSESLRWGSVINDYVFEVIDYGFDVIESAQGNLLYMDAYGAYGSSSPDYFKIVKSSGELLYESEPGYRLGLSPESGFFYQAKKTDFLYGKYSEISLFNEKGVEVGQLPHNNVVIKWSYELSDILLVKDRINEKVFFYRVSNGGVDLVDTLEYDLYSNQDTYAAWLHEGHHYLFLDLRPLSFPNGKIQRVKLPSSEYTGDLIEIDIIKSNLYEVTLRFCIPVGLADCNDDVFTVIFNSSTEKYKSNNSRINLVHLLDSKKLGICNLFDWAKLNFDVYYCSLSQDMTISLDQRIVQDGWAYRRDNEVIVALREEQGIDRLLILDAQKNEYEPVKLWFDELSFAKIVDDEYYVTELLRGKGFRLRNRNMVIREGLGTFDILNKNFVEETLPGGGKLVYHIQDGPKDLPFLASRYLSFDRKANWLEKSHYLTGAGFVIDKTTPALWLKNRK